MSLTNANSTPSLSQVSRALRITLTPSLNHSVIPLGESSENPEKFCLKIGQAEFTLRVRVSANLSQDDFLMDFPAPEDGFSRTELEAFKVVCAQLFRLALFDNGGAEFSTASAMIKVYPKSWFDRFALQRGHVGANFGLLRALWVQHLTGTARLDGQPVVWSDFKCVPVELGLGENPFAWTPVQDSQM